MEDVEASDSAALSRSPLHDDFEWALLRKFEGLWLMEDDPDFNYRVDQLFRLFYRARDLFYEVGPRDPMIWSVDPSNLHLKGSLDIYVRAYSIFEHERDGQPDSLIERARQICALGGIDEDGDPAFSDGQIFTALALREIDWAISALCDVCIIFQSEVKHYLEPLAALRELNAPSYWREVYELRTRNWREEQEKLINAYEYKARAETMMLLAVIASEGILPHRVTEFASELRQEGSELGHKQGREEFTKARKGKQHEHTRALENLAREWQIFTPKKFIAKIHDAMVAGYFDCAATGGRLSKTKDDDNGLRYDPSTGRAAMIYPETLKKILHRAKTQK